MLHIDDVPIIEREAKKKVITVVDINDVQKVNHYMALHDQQEGSRREPRHPYESVAALIEAERFMRDPKNMDSVAKAAAPTSRTVDDAKWAIEQYVKIEFWPQDASG